MNAKPRSCWLLIPLVLFLATACAHQRVGQIEYYRVSAPEGRLEYVEDHEKNEGTLGASTVIEKGRPIAIILKRAFIRYLKTFYDSGEVAVVVTTSELGEEGEPRLVEYFENQRQAATLNYRDTLIYGPKEWSGKSLRITIQLIEIDSDKNPLMSSYLKTVAGAVRTAFPQFSPAVSIASSIGEFLIKQVSKDDPEFTFHFTLYNDQGVDPNVPTLRTGSYVAIKQEWGRSVIEFGPSEIVSNLPSDKTTWDWFHLNRVSVIDPFIHLGRWLVGIFVPSPLSLHVVPHKRIWDKPSATPPELKLMHGDLVQKDHQPFRARTFVVLHITDGLMAVPPTVLTYMETQAKRFKDILTPDPQKVKELETMAAGFVAGLNALSLAEDARSLAHNPNASELSKAAFRERLERFAKEAWCKKDVSNHEYLLRIVGSIKPHDAMKGATQSWGALLQQKPTCS